MPLINIQTNPFLFYTARKHINLEVRDGVAIVRLDQANSKVNCTWLTLHVLYNMSAI